MSVPTENSQKTALKKEPFSEFFLRRVLPVVLMCIWVYAAMQISGIIVSIPMVKIFKTINLEPVWMTVYSALVYVLSCVIIIFLPVALCKIFKKKYRGTPKFLAKFFKKSPLPTIEELGFKEWPTFRDIGLAVVGFIVFMVGASILMSLMSVIFPWFNASETQETGFSTQLIAVLDRIVAFFALVVIAPIFEEIIFRGWLYGKIRARISLLPAMLLVSVLFGILHGQWNVGVNVFVLSLVLCAQREVTGTIHSGILLHMIKNGVAFYLLYIL